jgi:hypothetical protein
MEQPAPQRANKDRHVQECLPHLRGSKAERAAAVVAKPFWQQEQQKIGNSFLFCRGYVLVTKASTLSF